MGLLSPVPCKAQTRLMPSGSAILQLRCLVGWRSRKNEEPSAPLPFVPRDVGRKCAHAPAPSPTPTPTPRRGGASHSPLGTYIPISIRRRWLRHTLRIRPPSRERERPSVAVSVRRPSPIRSRRPSHPTLRFGRAALARCCCWWWFALPRDSSPTPARTSQVRCPPVHKGQVWRKTSSPPNSFSRGRRSGPRRHRRSNFAALPEVKQATRTLPD